MGVTLTTYCTSSFSSHNFTEPYVFSRSTATAKDCFFSSRIVDKHCERLWLQVSTRVSLLCALLFSNNFLSHRLFSQLPLMFFLVRSWCPSGCCGPSLVWEVALGKCVIGRWKPVPLHFFFQTVWAAFCCHLLTKAACQNVWPLSGTEAAYLINREHALVSSRFVIWSYLKPISSSFFPCC